MKKVLIGLAIGGIVLVGVASATTEEDHVHEAAVIETTTTTQAAPTTTATTKPAPVSLSYEERQAVAFKAALLIAFEETIGEVPEFVETRDPVELYAFAKEATLATYDAVEEAGDDCWAWDAWVIASWQEDPDMAATMAFALGWLEDDMWEAEWLMFLADSCE